MLSNIKIDAKKFILMQMVLLLIGYIVTFAFFNSIYANSFLMGAVAMLIANFVFFGRLFINKQFSPAIEIIIFYLSELLKLSIVAVITIMLAIYIKPKLFSYISGLVLLQLVVCFVPILFKKIR